MRTSEITEGHWHYQQTDRFTWTATNLRTGEVLPRTSCVMTDMRRFTYEASIGTQTRFTIMSGPVRAQQTRRHTN